MLPVVFPMRQIQVMRDQDEMEQKLFSFHTILDECWPCPWFLKGDKCCPFPRFGCGDPAAVEEVVRNCLEQDGMNIDEQCFQESIIKVLTKHSAAYTLLCHDVIFYVVSS